MITVTERRDTSLVSIMARRGQAGALATRLREGRGIEGGTCLNVAPSTWWAVGADATKVREALGGLASVVDQSDAYMIIRVTGSRVRDVLSKLVFIDLHPDAFAAGCVASTVAAHVNVTLWRVEDTAEGAAFELAFYRSFSSDFRHALERSCAEFA